MRERFFPDFDWHTVFVQPWTDYSENSFWIVLMGFLVSGTCGLVGCFVILRRMALVGDAISHSLLPGITIAFLLTNSRDTLPMMLGAIAAGVATVALIEAIRHSSRIKPDAAIGIVFSSLFAIGVILISAFADKIDLDAECVLYGELGFIPLQDVVMFGGMEIGPEPVVRMAIIGLIAIGLLLSFFKEMLVTSFDPGLAASLGINPTRYQYGLTLFLSVVIVSSFESVGVVLVIAMIIFPGATALLLTDRLPKAIWLSTLFSALYAGLGFHLATWLEASIAGGMTVIAGFIFGLVWIAAPDRGLLTKFAKRALKSEIVLPNP
ncbi:MAG: metal ABC transporter permease [Opitutales bacterium]|jgi:manganese/zinc/iron transport system permease protein|nr:metal ABC transporter permease [Opitutales bacterium]MBT5169866.1 metal ABC transporter permease [Opitutales bacterium]MBT5813844.1 metal ABC transporter permease [Opitutales bacterium]MBT6381006.1 metal ABC transporter permease [Opitutales bacterium]MBT6770814.1 metal ABC transporter permease [Opitutales bacterium]